MEEAEHYLLERSEQLNGDFYGNLLPLAEAMETAARHLAATVVYRALLDSILRRGQAKTYPHGVRYLKKLDRLAKSISDWGAKGTMMSTCNSFAKAMDESPAFGLDTKSDD